MHAGCYAWVTEKIRELGLESGKVLEIGSFRENGDDVLRPLFEDYTGSDMRAGPNVDVVCNADSLPFSENEFAAVVCVNTLEHDEHPHLTLLEAYRATRPGGYLLLGVPGFGFPLHEHPSDYWRFSEFAVQLLVRDAGYEDVRVEVDEGTGWFCLARK